uniref:Parathyroid hormone n=1 Tax=Sphaeramia orbicularis TaxID=375764 RepID=A0A672Y348_9TELE
ILIQISVASLSLFPYLYLILSYLCRKRAVSEAQLMHNHGEYKQLQERKDWLQMRLQAILPTLDRDKMTLRNGPSEL